MTIDIHALLEKNPITKYMVQPKFGYKYLGAYNPLDDQLLYDKNTGNIYTYYDKPKNVLDKIASRHVRHCKIKYESFKLSYYNEYKSYLRIGCRNMAIHAAEG